MPHAHGRFEVKLDAQPATAGFEAARIGRQTLDKQFHGPLQASSRGEMLAVMGEVKGSAAYVAIERVDGTLDGQAGTFVLIHRALMDRGTPTLSIAVVPDSGTDALTGLRGDMRIEITDGQHFYSFDYTLAATDTPAA